MFRKIYRLILFHLLFTIFVLSLTCRLGYSRQTSPTFSAINEKPLLIPQPKQIVWGKEWFSLSPDSVLIVADKKMISLKILNHFKKYLQEVKMKEIKITDTFAPSDQINTIFILGNPTGNPLESNVLKTDWNLINDQGYELIVKKDKKILIGCWAKDEVGIFYALQTIKQLIKEKDNKIIIAEVKITDYPSFKIRGIIEGTYTGPWTHTQRKEILEFMARYKMNHFVYAPKADDYVRNKWRKLYPEDKIKEFQELIDRAENNFIEFGYVLSPVKSVSYSRESSFNRIVKKYNQMHGLGIKAFGIFFDDILEVLSPRDSKHFFSIAEAHTYITNKVYSYLKSKDKDIKMSFCPTHYSGLEETAYLKTVRERLNPQIFVGWTGPDICSYEITSAQAKKFGEIIGRKPSIGDNYPVAGTWGLGPLRNRSPDLYKFVEGFVSNPLGTMPVASQIPLMTIADYVWNSDNYNPQSSFHKALLKFGGEDTYPYLKIFCEHFATSPAHFNLPPPFFNLREKFWNKYLQGKKDKRLIDEILKEFKMCKQAKTKLTKLLKNKEFVDEISLSLQKLENYGKAGEVFFTTIKSTPPAKNLKDRKLIKDIIENYLKDLIKERMRLE